MSCLGSHQKQPNKKFVIRQMSTDGKIMRNIRNFSDPLQGRGDWAEERSQLQVRKGKARKETIG